MTDLAWQAIGLGLLMATLVIGYRLALQRLESPQPAAAERLVLIFVLLTAAGGFWGAFPWWSGDAHAFAWRLPPLAGRMLAAAAWAFAHSCFLAMRTPRRYMQQLVALQVAIYLLPLTVAIIALYLGRFDWQAPLTFGFFGIVGVLGALALWALFLPAWPEEANSIDAATSGTAQERGFFVLVGIASGIWGLAQFLGLRFDLPGTGGVTYDPLTGKLIAVMFLTVAASSLFALVRPRAGRPVLWFIATYGAGAGAAALWGYHMGETLALAYLAFWGCAGGAALILLWWLRVRPPQTGRQELSGPGEEV